MGRIQIARAVVLVGFGLLLSGCPERQTPPAVPGPGGETNIICPGDSRCGEAFDLPMLAAEAADMDIETEVEFAEAEGAEARPARNQTCEIRSERVMLRCRRANQTDSEARPCPGPRCSAGTNPGRDDRCRIVRRYAHVVCPAWNNTDQQPETGPGEGADPVAPMQPDEEALAQ